MQLQLLVLELDQQDTSLWCALEHYPSPPNSLVHHVFPFAVLTMVLLSPSSRGGPGPGGVRAGLTAEMPWWRSDALAGLEAQAAADGRRLPACGAAGAAGAAPCAHPFMPQPRAGLGSARGAARGPGWPHLRLPP